MGRVLLEVWSTVPDAERAAFEAMARDRQGALQRLGVSYWVFERPDAPGELVQFLEARDLERLDEARPLAPPRPGDRETLLHQLEL